MADINKSIIDDYLYQIQMKIRETEDEIIFKRISQYINTETHVSKAELREALEKQRPMKSVDSKCGRCKNSLEPIYVYCPWCGQKKGD